MLVRPFGIAKLIRDLLNYSIMHQCMRTSPRPCDSSATIRRPGPAPKTAGHQPHTARRATPGLSNRQVEPRHAWLEVAVIQGATLEGREWGQWCGRAGEPARSVRRQGRSGSRRGRRRNGHFPDSASGRRRNRLSCASISRPPFATAVRGHSVGCQITNAMSDLIRHSAASACR